MSLKDSLPLPKERNLFLSEQVDQASMLKLTEKIIEHNEEDELYEKMYSIHNMSYKRAPIKIFIDSYGGSVYQCFGLLSIIEKSKTPIHTIVTGCAMSCGFMILIHGHKRFAYELATPLFHQVSDAGWGKLKDLEENLIETKRLQKMIVDLTLKKTKISKKQIQDNYEKKQDWYMSAKEALKLGVVDEII